ncbi:MAG: LysR substrate-binding domain-containing protein [Rubrimonas sp.]|uniref:hydrogen peroxide-inducible genes activator n=1 Tax=Rubrimonas sp. TaxID=2036015 RepID=UPI002FDF07B9
MTMPRVSLRQFCCLIALAEARSFRAAAARLGISQPALSAQIKGLEEALGLALVERRAQGAELTPVGREALGRIRAVVEGARALEDFAAGARKSLSGRLTLGVSPTIGPYLLPHVVARLHRRHPNLRLGVREGAPADLERELAEGAHDAILAQMPVRDPTLACEELFRERLLLLVAADHPLAAVGAVAPEQLAGLEVLTLDPRYRLREQVESVCDAFGARLSRDYEGSSLDALRVMTGMNAGVAFAPELYCRSELRVGGDVVALPLRGRALHRRIGLAWRRSLTEVSALRLLAELAREAFADLSASR